MNYISRVCFLILALNSLTESTLAQSNTGWELLSDVSYHSRKDPRGYNIEFPVFGERLKKMQGKMIQLRGYMVPLEELSGHSYFVLSALPYNICFFCGGAGPETVAEVYSLQQIPFTDKIITIRGKLSLNDSDPEHLMYILNEAKLISEH